jgi:putative hydrolase of the HAD superfamily
VSSDRGKHSAPSETTLQAVVFDLDGTLFDHQTAVWLALHDWLPGLDDGADEMFLIPGFRHQVLDFDRLARAWHDAEDRHLPAWQTGTISLGEQRRRRLRDFLPELGVRVVEDDLDELFAGYLATYRRHWHPYADAAACLRRVRAAGLATAVLTNGTQEQQSAKVAATGLNDLIDTVFASAAIGVAKPDEAAYQLVCQRLGVEPGTTLMVGDNYELDVRAARSAGLRAVHLDRAGSHRVPDPTRIATLADLTLTDAALGSVSV